MNKRAIRRAAITIAVLGLLLFVLIPQTDALLRSIDIVKQATPIAVLIAIWLTCMTYVLSTELYHLLVKHPVSWRSVALVQAATALTSRLVPVGIGSMSLNAIFLRKRRHSSSEALAVVATNNGLGLIGHAILLAIFALATPLPDDIDPGVSRTTVYWILVVLAAVIIAAAVSKRLRGAVIRAVRSFVTATISYRHHPQTIWLALAVNMVLSLVYVAALVATGQALGIDMPFGHYFMIYSFSLLTGAATPTPGGLVGVEAGLAAGFVAYGVATDMALAVALLYRLITYWLPILPGFIAFRITQRRIL